jgi:hypothetical protein
VPVKSVEQQAALSLHRTRDLLVRQRTQLVNMIRGLLAEFGVELPKGITHALAFARRVVAGEAHEVPTLAAKVIGALAEQALEGQDRIRELERDLLAWYRSNDLARRIATRLHPTHRQTTHYPLQRGSHPHRTFCDGRVDSDAPISDMSARMTFTDRLLTLLGAYPTEGQTSSDQDQWQDNQIRLAHP